MKKFAVCGACAALLLTTQVESAKAIDAYILSEFTTAPGQPTTAPFTINASNGVKLTLNGSGVATAAADIGALSVDVGFAFNYASSTGTINAGEVGGTTAGHVNTEVTVLDDVGFVQDGSSDALLNIDFGLGASVTFMPVPAGVLTIVIAEDAGLDHFRLEFDDGDGFDIIFAGLDAATAAAVLGRSDFGSNDRGSDIDQFYVFHLDQALSAGTFRITEIGQLREGEDDKGTRLEIDFAGAMIPEPTTTLMVSAGMALFGLLRRRRHA